MIITPKPGTDRENLLKDLTWVSTEAENARGSGGTSQEWHERYLRWVADAVRLLGRQASAADLERLVLTRRYWALQAIRADGIDPALNLLVSTELDERIAVLRQTLEQVQREVRYWDALNPSTGQAVLVVADSSFYIHHPQKLEDLDLREVLGIRQPPVRLIFPIVVVDELDRLKETGGRHPRWRAAYTLAVLDRVLQDCSGPGLLREEDFTPLQSGGIPRGELSVEIVLDPPGHHRLPQADDEIIDRALSVQTWAGRPVTLITYDTGQATRARAAGLATRKLPVLPEGDEPTP